MKKYLFIALILTLAPQFSNAVTADSNDNAFEAELRLLESKDEANFDRAERITNQESVKTQSDDFVFDDVGVKNSATERPETKTEIKTENKKNTRRIPSR